MMIRASSASDADDKDEGEASEDKDEEEASKDEEEKEEHLALADSTTVASLDVDNVPSAEETTPFDTDESAVTPPPPPAYRKDNSRMWRASEPTPKPFPFGGRADDLFAAYCKPTRGFKADYGFVGTLDAEIRHDPDREIGYGITDVWDDPDEIAEEIPASDVPELGHRMTNFVTIVRQDTDEIYKRLDDAQSDRSLMIGQLNLLRRDRHFHACTARLMESEARAAREAWTQMVALQSHQRPAGDPAHPDVPEEAGSSS
ncbi:hypothetical protein Tco_1093726 [Tanacetum coccineum]|uniref:Uncharacterized protein n=1 Tax=Tanacetum coccineum TaxID=301880 RepID=A0ABQ5IDI0_9ASTR